MGWGWKAGFEFSQTSTPVFFFLPQTVLVAMLRGESIGEEERGGNPEKWRDRSAGAMKDGEKTGGWGTNTREHT